MTGQPKNEGEGNRTAAKQYDEKARRFAETEDVESKAQEARDAVESDDEGILEEAEKRGKEKARDFDPQVQRDR
jgi:hypothetical protein